MSIQAALDRTWFRWFRHKKQWQEWRDFNLSRWSKESPETLNPRKESREVHFEITQPQENQVATEQHKGKFVYFLSKKNRQWYFRLVASNGKTICQSEGYTRKANVLKGIESVRAASRMAAVEQDD